ncbi:DedA family protein [Virgibacillus salarius]|nr:DedA family protein [Virgibacillus salarius]WBX81585.1 DedA family protein [Virgibacillus salarius]
MDMSDLGSFVAHYGYIGIFIVLILGIIGLPIPDEFLLTYVGYSVFAGRMSLSLSLLVAILGSVIGISISYFLGQKLGLPFIKRFGPKVHITEKNITWVQHSFRKFGGFFLLTGYFIPRVRHITAYMAGITSYRYLYFSIFAYIGAMIWVSTFIFLGMILGNNWEVIKHVFLHSTKIFWIMLFIIILYIYGKRWAKKREKAS